VLAERRKAAIEDASKDEESGVAEEGRSEEDAAGEGSEIDVDGDEPRYCYCNGVSYGEMVACDNERCSREWFHLKCAGLKEAPGENSEFLFFSFALRCSAIVWMLTGVQRSGIASFVRRRWRRRL
jgi:hypothetical protein